ncbi:P-type conjugative transfer protein TrbJ [Pseudoalteromonas sp. Of11M-6]|uniref:P-type conjugative transfer protein TrbJ n=1 Tax=Pseudoalteromonas sp. Of11M-6 TaxID=2917754 RepID=UPI001EF46AA2|nr:P-type conjugative transfer protein TrbJ [Pseudoalteromonas sp. Of11M-6]MCG7556251.1 P-type conjugative transfer protein TrbJ [Pseudoalteromonas sp. Of11M-6]
MKIFKKRILAAKLSCALVLGLGAVSALKTEKASAGIPVMDITNIAQSIMQVSQMIQQYSQMIRDWQTQLQQLEQQVLNTINPARFIWDDAKVLIGSVLDSMDSIRQFKNQFGSLNAYMSKFKDVDYYRDAVCFTDACSRAQMAIVMSQSRIMAKEHSEIRKQANDALVKSIDEQQDLLERDADTLRDLQNNAQTAQGQLEAIQHANQLASNQAQQLMQIRALLIAQQSALSAEKQTSEDQKSKEMAAGERIREFSYSDSSGQSW